MAGITCDYCGEGDNSEGMVLEYNEGMNRMHSACWKKYTDELKER